MFCLLSLASLLFGVCECRPIDVLRHAIAPRHLARRSFEWACADFVEERYEDLLTEYKTISNAVDCRGKEDDCSTPDSAQIHVLFESSIALDTGEPVAFDLATLYGNAFNYGIYTEKQSLHIPAGQYGSIQARAKQIKMYGTFKKCCRGFWSQCAEKRGVIVAYDKSAKNEMEFELNQE